MKKDANNNSKIILSKFKRSYSIDLMPSTVSQILNDTFWTKLKTKIAVSKLFMIVSKFWGTTYWSASGRWDAPTKLFGIAQLAIMYPHSTKCQLSGEVITPGSHLDWLPALRGTTTDRWMNKQKNRGSHYIFKVCRSGV